MLAPWRADEREGDFGSKQRLRARNAIPEDARVPRTTAHVHSFGCRRRRSAGRAPDERPNGMGAAPAP